MRYLKILLPLLFFFAAFANAQVSDTIMIKNKDGESVPAQVRDYKQGKVLLHVNGNRVVMDASELAPKELFKVREIVGRKCRPALKVKQKISTKSDVEKSYYYNNNETKNVVKKKDYEISVTSTSPYERDVFLFWIIVKGDVDELPETIVNAETSNQRRAYSYYGTKTYAIDEGGVKSSGKIITVKQGQEILETAVESASSMTERFGGYYRTVNARRVGTTKINIAVFIISKEGEILNEFSSSGNLLKELKGRRFNEIKQAVTDAFVEEFDDSDASYN